MSKKRRFGDRKDGRRVRTMSPMSYVIPYIMRTRNDAQNQIADTIDITEADRFLREMRAKGYKSISVLHVFIAAYIRAIAMRPGINRFCSGQKIYHRNTIEVNMAVKKEMSLDAPDTMIKVRFEPTDTITDVYEKFNAVVENNTHARHLYKRLGFVQVGMIPNGFLMKDGSYQNIFLYYYVL